MEFTPDKNREEAIAELLGCRDYVLVTAADLEDQEDGADSQYNVFYSDLMTTKGLIDYTRTMWKSQINKMK